MTDTEYAILCVDDERSVLQSLKRLLRKEPYRVYLAEGGEAGLDLLREHPVQVVISDQRMPGMTGTQFLQKVKELYPDTIRVILSGYAEAEAIVASINQGEIYRFLGKPWKDESLKTTIRQCFEHYDMIQENRCLQQQTRDQLEELQRLNTLLEASVETRTRALQLSQDIVEKFPRMVIGVSTDQEIMLANRQARGLPGLDHAVPGTDIEDLLPPEAVAGIRSCLTQTETETFTFSWEDRILRATPEVLKSDGEIRGCVLMLEEVGS